jgi:hypothetical protein
MDCFKLLKLRCQYEKVEVSTEGLKFPLKRYISFQLGGARGPHNREWLSLVDENGALFHIYNFEQAGSQDYELGKGEIRQAFEARSGRFLLICSDYSVRVRQRLGLH